MPRTIAHALSPHPSLWLGPTPPDCAETHAYILRGSKNHHPFKKNIFQTIAAAPSKPGMSV